MSPDLSATGAMSPDLSAIIARLRRAQPHNHDTMAVCDALMALHALWRKQCAKVEDDLRHVTFDRTEYQRKYMRDMRAARKAGMSTADYRNRNERSGP